MGPTIGGNNLMGEKDIRISISRRSVAQVAPYESEEASASVELSLDADTSAEEVIAPVSYTHLTLPTTPYV